MFGLSTTGSCALILSASVGYLITESTYHVVAGIAVVPALVLIADIAQAIDKLSTAASSEPSAAPVIA